MSPYFESLPYVVGSDTSRAAARAAHERAHGDAERIFLMIVRAGARGMTCDEVEQQAALLHQTAAARIKGLENTGWIKKTERTRRTRSNRLAVVYVRTTRAERAQVRRRQNRYTIVFLGSWGIPVVVRLPAASLEDALAQARRDADGNHRTILVVAVFRGYHVSMYRDESTTQQ